MNLASASALEVFDVSGAGDTAAAVLIAAVATVIVVGLVGFRLGRGALWIGTILRLGRRSCCAHLVACGLAHLFDVFCTFLCVGVGGKQIGQFALLPAFSAEFD